MTAGSAERGDPEGVIGAIVKPWADALPSLALRLAPGDSSNQVVVRIGRLRHQPFRLRLEPEKRWGEAYGSQFVERYSHGYVSITSPWADDWTERDECAEWTYRRWIESIGCSSSRSLAISDWGPDIVRNGEQSLPEWVEGLDQARRLGEDHIPVEAAAQRFMEFGACLPSTPLRGRRTPRLPGAGGVRQRGWARRPRRRGESGARARGEAPAG